VSERNIPAAPRGVSRASSRRVMTMTDRSFDPLVFAFAEELRRRTPLAWTEECSQRREGSEIRCRTTESIPPQRQAGADV
jgi:hypothetical protein